MARQSFYGKCGWAAITTIAAVVTLLALAVASAANAEGPRWDITVVPSPTNLHPESPRSEVDRLAVDATGGTFSLEVAIAETSSGNTTYHTSQLPYDASATEVESAVNEALKNTSGYSVAVTGGPGPTNPYLITWAGAGANENLAGNVKLKANGEALAGGSHEAEVSVLTAGSSAGLLTVTFTNVGDAPTSGTVTVQDALPSGIAATAIRGEDIYKDFEGFFGLTKCEVASVSCVYEGTVDPGDSFIMTVTVSVGSGLPTSVEDHATVTGGGLASTEVGVPLPISNAAAPFGIAPHSLVAALSTTQAGAHPDVTNSFLLATRERGVMSASPKDVSFDLPPGVVGNTVGMPRCSMAVVLTVVNNPEACPADTMVGMASIVIGLAREFGPFVVPVYNIAPSPGEPAAFGINALVVPLRLDTSVLSNGDYGVRVTANDISEAAHVFGSSITIWGVPADHNGPGPDRSLFNIFRGKGSFGGPSGGVRVPLLTNPQQCTEPLSAGMLADSWIKPGNLVPSESVSMGSLDGCSKLRIEPSFSTIPDTLQAGAPAGLHFDLSVPQTSTPDGLATPNVKDVTLKLPVGTVVNPSAAWGLKACSNAQFYGSGPRSQEPASLGACPREAQVGTVSVKTPALEEALEGQVYLAEPECDPCTPTDAEDGKMTRLFLQVASAGEGGIVVKLEGRGMIDQQTGQIVTTFKNNPQLPFSELKLKLSGGPRAVLANPRSCGSATSTMDITPWSSPFTPDLTPSFTFVVDQGCFGPQFAPSFVAGSTNVQAGAYTPFTVSFGRSDSDQYLAGLSMTMPPGLLGNIGTVPLCKEPEAALGTCGQGSLIGHVQVLTGPGADPFLVEGGQVFLTEGYEGAPYGLSIVVPAVAGPYTLSGTTGRGTVVVRAKIQVDPIDAHLTVSSDPLPTMLDGIPLQLKAVNVTIDRPQFTFNRTSCAKTAIGATLSSSEGMSAAVSKPFQVTNCAGLGFKPSFKVSTKGKTSRANGASLNVELAYPKALFGSQTNIAKVKVDLPKQLPSRLSTLQKACTARVFEANPAACPVGSKVGVANATTPIIPVPLTGPAYFVSYGGAKFPELVIVLSGYGVTVDLHGETFINEKTNITSSTFRQVPDVPIGTFELTLPQGPNSALAATANLCQTTLKMPTVFTAQNGTVIKQSTPITATGCPKHKAKHKGKKVKKSNRGRSSRKG